MTEKIIKYYNKIPKKKYFLLKVAVSTRNNERKLVHALGMPTDNQIAELKEYIYDDFEYKEFLMEPKEFFNLISTRQEVIKIHGFRIPYIKHPQVDEYFVTTVNDFYNLSKPYNLFRIRVGGESYAYGPLSHPEFPNYPSFYQFIKEHMDYDFKPGGTVDFCVLFPIEKAHMENLKITRSKIKFDVVGDLTNLKCSYYINTEKMEKKDKFDPRENNFINFKGKIKEIELTLWHSKRKLDYIRTRDINLKKLSKDSYWSNAREWSEYLEKRKQAKKTWQENIPLYILIGVITIVIGWAIITILSDLL